VRGTRALERAHQDDLQKKHAVEDKLDREVVSAELSVVRQAKNQRKDALGHAIHILKETPGSRAQAWMRCRSQAAPIPALEKD